MSTKNHRDDGSWKNGRANGEKIQKNSSSGVHLKGNNSSVDISRFEKLVSSALASFPKRLRDAIANVAIVIENSPRQLHAGEIEIGRKGVLLGLYEGVPQTQWGRAQSGILPDKITIFQQSIESLATDDNSLKELVRDTVWHEIGHHFGFTDKELRHIEKRRGQKSDC